MCLCVSSVPSLPGVGTFEVSEGEIFIDYAPHARWNPPSRLVYRGVARPASVSTSSNGGPVTFVKMHSARIWINEDRLGQLTDEANILLLAHELLYALGLQPGHSDYDIYHDSIMRSHVSRSYSDRILGPVDHDAIQALYAAYEPSEMDVPSRFRMAQICWETGSFSRRSKKKSAIFLETRYSSPSIR